MKTHGERNKEKQPSRKVNKEAMNQFVKQAHKKWYVFNYLALLSFMFYLPFRFWTGCFLLQVTRICGVLKEKIMDNSFIVNIPFLPLFSFLKRTSISNRGLFIIFFLMWTIKGTNKPTDKLIGKLSIH